MGPLTIDIGINVSAYCFLRDSLSIMISGWQCSYLLAKACLDRSLLQLSYQKRQLQHQTGAEVYLKAHRFEMRYKPSGHRFSLTNLLFCTPSVLISN